MLENPPASNKLHLPEYIMSRIARPRQSQEVTFLS
jgi:hypothetical protein